MINKVKLISWIKANFSVLLILGFVVVLSYKNYTPGTFLSGWDNLHPEFDFELNVKRSLFAVWQEYQGLGLLSAMSHASDLPRQLILWALSAIFPISFLRYLWQFMMLGLGPLGAYFFLKKYVFSDSEQSLVVEVASLLGGLFYLLNLGTLQNFYAPQSMFTTQYGFLPWLLLWALLYVKEKKILHLFYFALFSLLSSTQAYTATLIFAYFLYLGIALAFCTVRSRLKVSVLKSSLILAIVTFLINAYWLLPLGYFIINNSKVVPEATINVLSSEESFLMNKKYGTIQDVALLRGFWFKNIDFDTKSNSFVWMFEEWGVYGDKKSVLFAGYLLFSVILLGLISTLTLKKKDRLLFSILFLVSVFFLMNDNPPLGFVFRLLQQHVPLLKEALRFPYTKFSLVSILSFTVLFAYGIEVLLSAQLKLLPLRKVLVGLNLTLWAALLVFWMYPAFQGNLVYKRMRVDIPSDYFALFNWFKTQPTETRILNMPMYIYWAWPNYTWGYRGSGFLWYGIEQPILDRAFDVWNAKNEGAYKEFSYALYSANRQLFESVMEKYHVTWILLDTNVIAPGAPDSAKITFRDTFYDIVKTSPKFSLAAKFGNIEVYRFALSANPDSFVGFKPALAPVGSKFRWTEKDSAFSTLYSYYSSDLVDATAFPFISMNDYARSNVAAVGQSETLSLTYSSPKLLSGTLKANSYLNSGDLVVLDLYVKKDSTSLNLVARTRPPKLIIHGREASLPAYEKVYPIKANANLQALFVGFGENVYKIDAIRDGMNFVASTYIDPSQSYTVYASSNVSSSAKDVLAALTSSAVQACGNPVEGSYAVQTNLSGLLKLESKNNIACIFAPVDSYVSEGINEVRIKYNSTGTFPSYCLFSEKLESCLNDKEKFVDLKGGGSLVDEVVVNPKNQGKLQLYLYTEPNVADTSVSNDYSEVTLSKKQTLLQDTFLVDKNIRAEVSLPVSDLDAIGVIFPKILAYSDYTFKQDFSNFDAAKFTNNCDGFNKGTYSGKTLIDGGNSFLELSSLRANACITFAMKQLFHRYGYVIQFVERKIAGKDQEFCLSNYSSDRCDIRYKALAGSDWTENTFFQPPMDPDGRGYNLFFESWSIGDNRAVLDLDGIAVYPMPYNFLKSVRIETVPSLVQPKDNFVLPVLQVTHQNPAHYSVNSSPALNGWLTLNQTFDRGWVLLCGFKLCEAAHYAENNWGNTWKIENASEVSMVYLPQILEVLGLVLSFGSLSVLLVKAIFERNLYTPSFKAHSHSSQTPK